MNNSEFTPAFFDDASAAWRANKIRLSSGGFRYRCDRLGCKNNVCGSVEGKYFCKWHKSSVFASLKKTPFIEELD